MASETNSSEHTSIEIGDVDQQLVSSNRDEIGGVFCPKSPFPSECCIFKVPILLRRHKENAYVPNVVSIGPLHRDKGKLKEMERVKKWYFHCLLDRSPTAETNWHCFYQAIKEMEPGLRECYPEQISLSVEQFVKTMVVDGCFIIELFRKYAQNVTRHKDDPVFNMCWMYLALANDLLLLENQLPWSVLQRLWDLTNDQDEQDKYSLPDLALRFFGNIMLKMPRQSQSSGRFRNKHLLDFLRSNLVSSFAATELEEPLRNEIPMLPLRQRSRRRRTHTRNFMRCCGTSSYAGTELKESVGILIPCVTELLQAGVKFRRGNENDLLNIKFNNGVIEIPPILIQDNAESLFRNLIAFEQCDPGCKSIITSYALLLDNLINSSEDVDFLCQKGIVLNCLSTEDIAGVFNRLYNDTGINGFSYGNLCQKVNEHYKARCHRWQAILRRDYFNSPWSILSFLAAILILGLSVTQTVFSILSYKVSLNGPARAP